MTPPPRWSPAAREREKGFLTCTGPSQGNPTWTQGGQGRDESTASVEDAQVICRSQAAGWATLGDSGRAPSLGHPGLPIGRMRGSGSPRWGPFWPSPATGIPHPLTLPGFPARAPSVTSSTACRGQRSAEPRHPLLPPPLPGNNLKHWHGSFSRADRGIGGVRHVAPPTWLIQMSS